MLPLHSSCGRGLHFYTYYIYIYNVGMEWNEMTYGGRHADKKKNIYIIV